MSYLGEFRRNIRPLAAASIGSGTGLPLIAYTNSVFAPHIVKQFGWSRAQFALVGLAMLSTLLILPIVGRLTDRLGVKPVALLGSVLLPLCFVGYSLMQGSFGYFLFLSAAVLAVGSMTSALVYTRLIAESFDKAQGLALTVVNCAPAFLAMVTMPGLNWIIETYGWRLAYIAFGVFTLVGGLLANLLIPKTQTVDHSVPQPVRALAPARGDFGIIVRSRLFWIIALAFFLCLLGTPLHASQMNMMLVENGLTMQNAANVVSIYAASTIVGRIACGVALDRFPTPYVAAASMFLPAIGLFMLATSFNTLPVVTLAMILVGIYVGAESDIMAYLVARYFKLKVYNSTLSLLYCCTFLAAAGGAGGISLSLKLTDSFSPFMYVISGTIVIGSLLFLLLPKCPDFEKIG